MTNETPTSLYRHFAADGSLLYVGISLSWPARTRAHSKGSAWFGQVTRVEIEQFPSREVALTAECTAIRRERPKFNIIHNRVERPKHKRSTKFRVAESTDILRPQLARDMGGLLLGQVSGPHAIVGPALVYHGSTISVMVAHGTFGAEGELTEIVLGELFPEIPQWTDVCDTVLTIRQLGELDIEEARGCRREIIKVLSANLKIVQSFDTDLALAAAYATQFPSSKSRQVLNQVISEQRQ